MSQKVVIIGSGPSAHTAAIYLARAMINPILFEGECATGIPAGGQLMITTDVENFPGFPEGISGPDLMIRMRQQSVRWGTQIISKTVDAVDLSSRPFKLQVGSENYEADVLIVATGATAKRLHLPREEILWQKGISACATCDGALPCFRDKHIVVVGGGDSACEEAMFLTRYASNVTMLIRSSKMRASQVMQERVKNHKKIEIMFQTSPVDVIGDDFISAILVKDNETGQQRELPCSGLFYAIGHTPNVDFLKGQVECDEQNYIKVDAFYRTSMEGVFACGDVQDKRYRQAITAAGAGCMVALEVEKLIQEN